MRSTIYNLAIGTTVVLLSSCGGLSEEIQEILGTLEPTPEPSATSTPVPITTPAPIITPAPSTPAPSVTPSPTPPRNITLNRSDWILTASNNSDALFFAIDESADTRWTTRITQRPNQWLNIDLNTTQSFNNIVLESDESPNDYPRGYEVYTSSNGVDWGAAITEGNGREPTTRINFTTVNTRYLRIVQTGTAERYWWSIHELNLSLNDSLPTPSSTPVPVSTATPEPTPEPTPEATPEPTPEPTPEATPEATPEPTPVPTPEPTPVPTPVPTTLSTVQVDTLVQSCSTNNNLMPDIRRLTNLSYIEAVESFLGYRPPRNMILYGLPPQNRDKTITNVNFGLRVGRDYTNRTIAVSEDIVNAMDWTPFYNEHRNNCSEYSDSCNETLSTNLFEKAYGATPTEDDLAPLLSVFDAAESANIDFEDAAQIAVRSILSSPRFFYFVSDPNDAIDRTTIAKRLSLLIYNHTNEPSVMAAANAGQFDTLEGIESFTREALNDEKVSVALEEFYYDWLNLDRFDFTVDLTSQNYDNYSLETNDALREDITDYLNTIVQYSDMPFMNVFSDSRAFIRPETSWIYNDSSLIASPNELQDISHLPKRSGLLTHPAMLALSLKIEAKSIVDRGVFINEHILCRDIPLPAAVTPIDPTLLPENASQREQLEQHVVGACAGCHESLDAPGYALEAFGPIGEHKETDVYGNPLLDDGVFDIDGSVKTFDNVHEFSALLTQSNEVAQCVVQRRLSHALARVADWELDSCEIERLTDIYIRSNYDLKELTVGIATSHYFTN